MLHIYQQRANCSQHILLSVFLVTFLSTNKQLCYANRLQNYIPPIYLCGTVCTPHDDADNIAICPVHHLLLLQPQLHLLKLTDSPCPIQYHPLQTGVGIHFAQYGYLEIQNAWLFYQCHLV